MAVHMELAWLRTVGLVKLKTWASMFKAVMYIHLTMHCSLPKQHSKRVGREGVKYAWGFLNTKPVGKWQGDNVEIPLSFVKSETHHYPLLFPY